MSRLHPYQVGIQGVRASFHDIAAKRFFRDDKLATHESPSFEHLCQALKAGVTDVALMAIENSTVGSLISNLRLLDEYRFYVIGEITIAIEMSLMALPGQKLNDLRTVFSHPVALQQCSHYLAAHPQLSALATADTAASAKDICDKNLKGHAAIAHSSAAAIYGLEVIAQGIANNRANFTRFLVLTASKPTAQTGDHIMLRFEINCEKNHKISNKIIHEENPEINLGALLNEIESTSAQILRIQCLPYSGQLSHYVYFIDIKLQGENQLTPILQKTIAPFVFGQYGVVE